MWRSRVLSREPECAPGLCIHSCIAPKSRYETLRAHLSLSTSERGSACGNLQISGRILGMPCKLRYYFTIASLACQEGPRFLETACSETACSDVSLLLQIDQCKSHLYSLRPKLGILYIFGALTPKGMELIQGYLQHGGTFEFRFRCSSTRYRLPDLRRGHTKNQQ